jgi:uncharacterized protein (TIGR03067 family)
MSRRRRELELGSVAAAAVVALAAAGMLWPGDASRIRGAWAGDGVRLTFRGDVVALEWRESDKAERHHFRLDPAVSPARIVTFDADAPSVRQPVRVLNIPLGRPSAGSPGAECRGIYELRGDRLRLCLPLPGAGFPAGFDPAAGRVFVLRRE